VTNYFQAEQKGMLLIFSIDEEDRQDGWVGQKRPFSA